MVNGQLPMVNGWQSGAAACGWRVGDWQAGCGGYDSMPEFYWKQQVTARIDAVNHVSLRLTPESINKGWRMASGAWLGLETCHSSQMKTAPQQGHRDKWKTAPQQEVPLPVTRRRRLHLPSLLLC